MYVSTNADVHIKNYISYVPTFLHTYVPLQQQNRMCTNVYEPI